MQMEFCVLKNQLSISGILSIKKPPEYEANQIILPIYDGLFWHISLIKWTRRDIHLIKDN